MQKWKKRLWKLYFLPIFAFLIFLLWSKHKVHGTDFSYIYYRSTARITAIQQISCWRIDVKDMMSLFDREMSKEEIRKFVDFIEDVTHEFIYDICHFNETGQTLTSIQDQHAAFNQAAGMSIVTKNTQSNKNSQRRRTLWNKKPNNDHSRNMVETAKDRFMQTLSKNLDKQRDQTNTRKTALHQSKLDKLKSTIEDNNSKITRENMHLKKDISIIHQKKSSNITGNNNNSSIQESITETEMIHDAALQAIGMGASSGAVTHRERDPSYLRNRWRSAKDMMNIDKLKQKHVFEEDLTKEGEEEEEEDKK